MKPSAVYSNRMQRYRDEVWLIWSNKRGCWYRDQSQGYTNDVTQAGLFTREEAARHYTDVSLPKSHRITEPFPASSVAALVRQKLSKLQDDIASCERLLACFPRKGLNAR